MRKLIHDHLVLRACSSNPPGPPSCKASACSSNPQTGALSCEAKPPDLLLCSSQIPIWGSKRARGVASPQSDDVLLRFSQILPIWGSKRARSGFIRPNWRDWSNIGDGPAGLIAEHLLASDVADYVSFRAVCRRWRLCSTDPRAHGILDCRFHPRQWIMLRGTGVSPYRRCFLNLSSGYSRYVDLPELHGHDVFGPTTEGLLVLLDIATYVVRLLNPFTRQAAKLPPATTLMTQSDLDRTSLIRVMLSVSGAGLADDHTIAVHFSNIRTLAIVKPGDEHWILVNRGIELLPAMSFAGRFYCATSKAVMVVETSANQPPRLAIAASLSRPFFRITMDTVHLVDNDGELMLVDREYRGNDNKSKYKVHRVDLDARKMVPINGLGGRAVFIGSEIALSVSPLVFPSINANAIYLGFESLVSTRLDNSPIDLMTDTAHPRQLKESRKDRPIYGPWGLDDYLSWFVTGYGDALKDT